jgi:ribonuclease III
MGSVALAVFGALEPSVHDRAMSRVAKPGAKIGAKPDASKTAQPVNEGAAAITKRAKAAPAAKRIVRKSTGAATELEKRIGYKFKDRDLLARSLTHISALTGGNRANSYQRLEFLGDRVLGLAIADMLFGFFPKADEGELSRRLAELVRREACAEVGRAIELGAALHLGGSEAGAGGRARDTILSDACEALIGAVYLDGGYAASAALVERLWGERMRAPVRPLRDAKTILQEWALARGLPPPVYREIQRTGPQHSLEFRIAAVLPNKEPAEGLGRSKRIAEQEAAAAMLKREGVRTDRADG